MEKTPKKELYSRMVKFRAAMDMSNPQWKLACIIDKVNQYYFTGTMQDGMLLVPRDGEAVYWVRMSFERAIDESDFPDIRQMKSYRDAATAMNIFPEAIYLETDIVPVAMLERLRTYFKFKEVRPLDQQIAGLRAVKSAYELALMRKSGAIHQRVLEEIVPTLFREGVSEAELSVEIYAEFMKQGYQGIARFSMFGAEMSFGLLAFGDNSNYPTNFNGPGGSRGIDTGVPILGSRSRKLGTGDLVFIDMPCGVSGYHTDKTMTYVYGGQLPDYAVEEHLKCLRIQQEIAAQLKPGTVPSDIYRNVMADFDPEFLPNFMGFGGKQVKFLGHGIGLQIDETPVIADGFNDPMEEGMVFALEPKKGVIGVGMVGVENTFIVTKSGGECITGTNPGLIAVR